MTSTALDWAHRHKITLGITLLVLAIILILVLDGSNRPPAAESSNTGVSSGVNDGEEALPPSETSNY